MEALALVGANDCTLGNGAVQASKWADRREQEEKFVSEIGQKARLASMLICSCNRARAVNSIGHHVLEANRLGSITDRAAHVHTLHAHNFMYSTCC